MKSKPPSMIGTPAEARLRETIATYDRIAEDYAKRFASADLREHRERFTRGIRQNGRVLDAGCGAGRDCSHFETAGLAVVGVDLSAGLLAQASRVSQASFITADIRNLPFRKGSFAGVWCCAVLLHLNPREALVALLEMHRVMEPGGSIFVSVRVGEGDEWQEDSVGGRRWFQLYDEKLIGKHVMGAGFALSQVTVEPGVASRGTWINIHGRRTS